MVEKKSVIIFLMFITFSANSAAIKKQSLAQRFIDFVLKRDSSDFPSEIFAIDGKRVRDPSDIFVIDEISEHSLEQAKNSKKVHASLDILEKLLKKNYRKKELSKHTLEKVADITRFSHKAIEARKGTKKIGIDKANSIITFYKENETFETLFLPQTNIEQEIKFFKELFKEACKGYPCNKRYLLKIQEEFKQWIETHKILKYKIGLQYSEILEQVLNYGKGISKAIQERLKLIESEKMLGIGTNKRPPKRTPSPFPLGYFLKKDPKKEKEIEGEDG